MPAAKQVAMADADSVPERARYVEPKGDITDERLRAIESIRAGDVLWVADLTVLADGRDRLVMLLRELSARKVPVAIHEGRTGRVSLPPHDGQHMAFEAAARWSSANKNFGLMTATEAGGVGGKKAKKHRRDKMLPAVKAKSIWLNPANYHMNTDQAVEEVNRVGAEDGFKRRWSKAALYREFGRRDVPAGPKVK